MNTTTAQLYETDFYGWIQQQTDAMRARNLAGLDFDHLIEEVEDMGKSRQRALESRLEVLLMHLLKWQYQADFRSKSWQFTIEEQRIRIAAHLKKNPSLKSTLTACVEEAYPHAKRLASRETGIDQSTFPAQCPWTFNDILDEDFWPEPA